MTLAPEKLETPPGYHPLDDGTLAAYLARSGDVAARLGGRPRGMAGAGGRRRQPQPRLHRRRARRAAWRSSRRCPMSGWWARAGRCRSAAPCSSTRRWSSRAGVAPAQTPRIYHYDHEMALTVMELLRPHVIMRKGHGRRRPLSAFRRATSRISWRPRCSTPPIWRCRRRRRSGGWRCSAGNTALCKITEDLIFTDPYRVAELNRWTSPQLDGIAAEIRADTAAKARRFGAES